MSKQYSDRLKSDAIALAASLNSYEAAARKLGIKSGSLISGWEKGKGVNPEIVMTAKQKREEWANLLEDKLDLIHTGITASKVTEAPLRDLVSASAKVIETIDRLRWVASPDAALLSGKTPEEIAEFQSSGMAKLAALGVLKNQHVVDDGSNV